MHIYFDETLIDENAIISLTNSHKLYDKDFYLGGTSSNAVKLSVEKNAVLNHPNIVTIKNDASPEQNYAVLHVDEINETKYEYEYTLTDALTLLDFYYDASQIFVDGKTTLLEIAQDICEQAGLELATLDFRGHDKIISWYDNTRTARQYIGYIAELNGGFARIGTDGELYFIKQNTESKYSISVDDCEDFNLGSYHKITRVVYDFGIDKYEFGDEEFDTLYLDPDNVFITSESDVEAIYNEINNFEFYSINCGNCPISDSIKSGDIITYIDGVNSYPTIACFDITYYGEWFGTYKLEINSFKVEETSKSGINTRIKNIEVKVDRDANTITQLVSQTDEINGTLNRVQSTLADTYSKIEIQNIVDGTGTDGVVVSKVITEAGYTFDKEGLKIYTDANSYNSLHNNEGTYYKDGSTILGQTTKDGSKFKDMDLYGTYRYGKEDIDDEPMFIAMLYNDNNSEECFGHFYNGSD